MFVLAVFVFVFLLSGSAWAANYNIEAEARLNDDGTMRVQLTYLRDGQRDPIWGILNQQQRVAFAERISLVINGHLGNDPRYLQSRRPVILDEFRIQATFEFNEPFVDTHIYIATAYLRIHDYTEEWMNNILNMSSPPVSIDDIQRAEEPYNGEYDYAGMINHGNPLVLVIRDGNGGGNNGGGNNGGGNNGGSSSSSGCNAGFGMIALLLVGIGFVTRKSLKA